ncbi:MAG: WecB/TagA/CpsF family glycosyltransferase [Sandaracinaceae bacterium]|nr:WecB/TagA/CpsF family glycosyltransferase [Sandaracinaceae bacterium]
MSDPSTPRERLWVGSVPIDVITFAAAIDAIEELVTSGRGGSVFTPNVDHVVLAEEDARFRRAYADATLSLVDGTWVLWASRALRKPLPEKISGSDLMVPVIERAARRGFRVYLLGGGDGVAKRAAERLTESYPDLVIAGYESPRIDVDEPAEKRAELVARVKATRPDIVFVCLGAPKQELWIHDVTAALAPAVLLGVGAAIDFVAGTVQRAPAWVSATGVEWLYRLVREPRRLWRRYLLRDPKFFAIVARTRWSGAPRA